MSQLAHRTRFLAETCKTELLTSTEGMPLPLPEIAGYTVIDRIGTGGFASVYRATRHLDEERVAIKVLHEHTSEDADLRLSLIHI